jgi:hypothetical protein
VCNRIAADPMPTAQIGFADPMPVHEIPFADRRRVAEIPFADQMRVHKPAFADQLRMAEVAFADQLRVAKIEFCGLGGVTGSSKNDRDFPCNDPEDRDSLGRRRGDRASSRRPSGRP